MAKKVFKTFFRIAEFLLGFLIILLLLLFIRLSTGPIEIKNLTPMIVAAFTTEEQDVQVNIKDAYIELALSRGRLMDIRLDELDVSDADGFVLTVQKANVSFNPFWLLLGKLALRDVDLESPYIQMNLNNQEDKTATEKSKPLGRQLHRIRKYAEKLDKLKVQNAQLVLAYGENSSISLPNLNVQMSKNFLAEMDIKASADVYFDGTFSQLNLDAQYDVDTKKFDFKTELKKLNLSNFKELSAYLIGRDFIIDASVNGSLDLSVLKLGWQKAFNEMSFEIKTLNPTSLYLTKPIDTTYQIDEVLIRGKTLPQLTGVEFNDSQVSISGKKAKINATISDLTTFFESKNLNDLMITLNASLSDIPMSLVPNLWPASLGSSAHAWVKENVLDGNVQTAVLDLTLKGGKLNNFISVLNVSDAVVRYVDEMMPLTKGRVRVTFEKNQIKMDVLAGVVEKVKAVGGYVNFLDLDKQLPRFDMAVQFEGKITDGLAVVSTPPLNVCDMIMIPCQQINGFAKGTVKLAFPFLEEGIEHFITYSVSADLEETGFPLPKTDLNIGQGNFKLFVNNDKLSLDGRALLDDNPISLDVVKSFKDNDENASLYRVKLPLTVSMLTPYFGHIGDFFKGSLLTDITVYPQDKNKTMINVDVGLKDAEISLPIGYTKEFNQDGLLKATLSLKDDKLVDIPSVYLSIPDEKISLKGSVQLPKDKLFVLDLSEIKSPRTEAQAKISIINEHTFDIAVLGKSLDVSDLLHGRFWSDDKTISQTPMNFKIQGNIDTLYLSDKEPFKNVRLSLEKQDGHWNAMDGVLVGTVPFTFSLNEKKNALNIQTDDVGDFLRRAGFTDRIKGGHLNTMISQDEKGQLSGELLVQNYELTDTGFFMQAATLLGIVDALRGNTIAFDKAIIPFTLSTLNDLEIKDAVASGTAVGFTLRGNIQNNAIDFNGSVVPAYALNSLLGKIPVIGTLLSGEEGGGLIGVSYHVGGNTDNPEFSFNPASLLTPGIFRRLFSAF